MGQNIPWPPPDDHPAVGVWGPWLVWMVWMEWENFRTRFGAFEDSWNVLEFFLGSFATSPLGIQQVLKLVSQA